jgi:glycosyltransferase involved in cell wall biosynthesis
MGKQPQSGRAAPTCAYRFGFVLSTGAGNLTRYLNLRKYAERDREVECVWAPNPGHIDDDPLHWLPRPLHARALSMRVAAPVLRRLSTLDAIMFHAFEPYLYTALRSLVARRPALVWSQDDPSFWKEYGLRERPAWRARARCAVDCWCTRRSALLLPFSRWAGEALIAQCRVPSERVHPIPVGIDLDAWPYAQPRRGAGPRPRILFVGGDFVRKGGDLLLDVFKERFSAYADLHLVSEKPPRGVPSNAFVYTGLAPGDTALRELFAQADLFVLATRADLSPNVILEAMATGVPVVATRMCGIPEMVRHGETGFLVPPGDAAALAECIQTLLSDPERRRQMGAQARRIAERDFSAAVNVPRILDLMKRCAAAIGATRSSGDSATPPW